MKAIAIILIGLATVLSVPTFSFQKESRNVEDFDRISVSIGADVFIKLGSKTSVELSGDQDDLEDVETRVEDGMLKIGQKGSGWSSWNNDDVTVYITVKTLTAVHISSSAKVEIEDVLKSDTFSAKISGSGRLTAEIDVEKLKVSISGSGTVALEGKAKEADTSISGSGRIKAEGLTAEILDAGISGSGSCYVTVGQEIDAHISGSGRIYYGGNPNVVNVHSSGSGTVRKL